MSRCLRKLGSGRPSGDVQPFGRWKRPFSSLPKWVVLVSEFDQTLCGTPLSPEHLPNVQAVFDSLLKDIVATKQQALQRMYCVSANDSAATGGFTTNPVKCNLVAHFFVARLFEGLATQLRIHMLTDISEDIAHSHGRAFVSHCVAGRYHHRISQKQIFSDDVQCLSQLNKDRPPDRKLSVLYETRPRGANDFLPPITRVGRFVGDAQLSHDHQPGEMYFMPAAPIYHQVCVSKEHLFRADATERWEPNGKIKRQPIVSLVLREKVPRYEQACFLTEDAPMPHQVATASTRVASRDESTRCLLEVADAVAQKSLGDGKVCRIFTHDENGADVAYMER